MMSTSMRLPDADEALADPEEIRRELEHSVDLILDGGHNGLIPTTVVDLTQDVPEVVRQGLGEFV